MSITADTVTAVAAGNEVNLVTLVMDYHVRAHPGVSTRDCVEDMCRTAGEVYELNEMLKFS